ncbi:MAG: hypothetical protein HC905_04865 [Bacteroidales bacterium]|nr:hypothetical protein [Bacteroidales bacterium]
MKSITLTALLIFYSALLYSQKNMDDVVYLKNGSRIQGVIQFIIPDSIVQIKQSGGTLWVFKMDEVSIIDKEEKINLRKTLHENMGYQFGLNAGFLAGSDNNRNKAPFGVEMIHAYKFTTNIAIGLGAGVEFFEATQVPLYLDLRYYFNQKYYATYLFVQGGGMVPIDADNIEIDGYGFKGKIGYMVNPGIGFLFPLNERSAISVGLSYRFHELKYSGINNIKTDYLRVEKMNRFNFRLGFILY